MFINTLIAPKFLQSMLILLAVAAVAVADIFLKKATAHGNLFSAIRSPWMYLAIGLYLFQILFFTLAFAGGLKLSMMGAMQTALYGVIVLAAGAFLYKENLSPVQVAGIVMAFAGVVLINWR